MAAPTIVSRADHPISRTRIDPDALRVLYRLRKFNHTAYLVGGGVRDLLLDRRPKDFDIGTSAHPHEVKRIFRNCWIIGRRFRLAHVKFGNKTIEVATFRRQVEPPPAAPPDASPAARSAAVPPEAPAARSAAPPDVPAAEGGVARRAPVRRDNTFGSPEEDAFRRDFTINALFYDIATFAIIDYVGGMKDLRRRLIRCIGEPGERFHEDPVRMLRAVTFGARLGFRLDAPVREAIAEHHGLIAQAAPARLLEELYKILRGGLAARTFGSLSRRGLLQHLAPEVERCRNSRRLRRSLLALDAWRAGFDAAPDSLSNAILLGSLAVPVQEVDLAPRPREDRTPRLSLGDLPVPRRDIERLRQILLLQPRLVDPRLPARAARGILTRECFPDALTWLRIHGGDPDAVARWEDWAAQGPGQPRRRHTGRRRRGRRRRRPRTDEPQP
ncbi:MAG: poly(A) polymerase [Acidobacteria bacterium]|nr:poly(A) polymerase [Acidobacteriota bacterium]